MVLSNDAKGSQLAFINTPGSGAARLEVLKWKAGQGTSATTPVSPDSSTTTPGSYVTCRGGSTSCLLSLAFGNGMNDSNSAPFYNYASDTLYVGDNGGRLHKFTGVFNGTPREVTAGGWPVNGRVGNILSSPVFDSGSNNIFVGDVSGNIRYVKETGSVTGVCSSGSHGGVYTLPRYDRWNRGRADCHSLGRHIVDGPLVDTTNATVFFFDGAANAASDVCGTLGRSTCFGVVEQTNTQLGNPIKANVGGGNIILGTVTHIHAGAFDNTYINSGPATGFLYVCGKERGATLNRPALSRIGFDASGVMNRITSADLPLADVLLNTNEECSPVTEIYNGSTDRMFASIFANGDLAGACTGTCSGACLYSFNVTTFFPATCSARLEVIGGTSGLIIDNTVGTPGASEVYFTPLSGGTAVQASQAGLN